MSVTSPAPSRSSAVNKPPNPPPMIRIWVLFATKMGMNANGSSYCKVARQILADYRPRRTARGNQNLVSLTDLQSKGYPFASMVSQPQSARTTQPRSVGQRVWCPLCKEYVRLLKVQTAATIIDASPRTIYRYIEEGRIFAVKAAGKTLRLCDRCLLKPLVF